MAVELLFFPKISVSAITQSPFKSKNPRSMGMCKAKIKVGSSDVLPGRCAISISLPGFSTLSLFNHILALSKCHNRHNMFMCGNSVDI
jgi:hypothetical protein